jgi:hypothetical protein
MPYGNPVNNLLSLYALYRTFIIFAQGRQLHKS